MQAESPVVCRLISLIFLLCGAFPCAAQPAVRTPLSPAQAQALVSRALANELKSAQDASHPMRYVLDKTTPRLTTAKEIVETKDGDVARLLSIGGQPLSAADAQREQARLDALLRDPRQQRHRKQNEDADATRALNVLKSLPIAFLYHDAGPADEAGGIVEKFTFQPNPDFDPPDLETQALTAMSGELWIDRASERVTRLEGHLQHDVDFGWGILGRLSKGGWIVIEQADVGAGEWRTVRLEMAMSGRVVLKTRVFDTTEVESQFAPVAGGMDYRKAIQMLLAGP